jgi:hypothetical protein
VLTFIADGEMQDMASLFPFQPSGGRKKRNACIDLYNSIMIAECVMIRVSIIIKFLPIF